jgi:hypothetical protein
MRAVELTTSHLNYKSTTLCCAASFCHCT